MAVQDSPFPGMDPYLERRWHPVHTQLVGAASRALNRQLPSDLVARPEERVGIEAEEDGPSLCQRVIKPDTHVFEPIATSAPTGGLLTAPFKLVLRSEPITERSVQILTVDGERLLTVIEFVAPGAPSVAGPPPHAPAERHRPHHGRPVGLPTATQRHPIAALQQADVTAGHYWAEPLGSDAPVLIPRLTDH